MIKSAGRQQVLDSYHKALTVFPQIAAEILAWIEQQD